MKRKNKGNQENCAFTLSTNKALVEVAYLYFVFLIGSVLEFFQVCKKRT